MWDPDKIKVGIAPIGWTNDDLPELGGDIPFQQCISEMHAAGFQGTEVGSKFPRDPGALLDAVRAQELEIASQWFSTFFTGGAGHAETVSAFEEHASFLEQVGARLVVVSEQGGSVQGQLDTPLFPNKPTLDEAGWTRLARGLEEIGRLARARHMTVAYHHHLGTVVQDRAEVDRLMVATDPDLVKLLVDTGHLYCAGGDPARLLADHADRVAHIHLKDVRAPVLARVRQDGWSFLHGVKEGLFTVPGDGNVDFAPVFATIKRIGYVGWLVVEAEQDPAMANPLVYARKARRFLRDRLGV